MRQWLPGGFSAVLAALACVGLAAAQPAAEGGAAPIGVARMEADGTLVLRRRAEGPHGAVGHGTFVYRPHHRDYQDVLRHLGGLRPGEHKPVPPWPEPPAR